MFVSEYSQVLKAETTLKPVRIFRVVLLFSYQRTLCLCELVVHISDSLFILPQAFSFVNNFFAFFKSFSRPETFHFRGGVSYYHIVPCFVNNFLHLFFKAFTWWWKWRKKRNLNLLRFFFYFLLVVNGERGIWTLAPVARPTPLAGAPLRPLEYFSEFMIPYDFALSTCVFRRIAYYIV